MKGSPVRFRASAWENSLLTMQVFVRLRSYSNQSSARGVRGGEHRDRDGAQAGCRFPWEECTVAADALARLERWRKHEAIPRWMLDFRAEQFQVLPSRYPS